jgi:hypothetical protein
VVRDKEHDMPIPSSAPGDELFARRPELRRFTALSRFTGARPQSGGSGGTSLDLSATEALKARIHVFDPERDGAAFRAPAAPPMPDAPVIAAAAPATVGPAVLSLAPTTSAGDGSRRARDESPVPAFPPNTSPVSVVGTVRAGDVVTITDAPEGLAVLAAQPLDRGVIGIVGGARGATWSGQAPIVVSGVVALCNVDATGGAIAVGDLLVASALPGHAMPSRGGPVGGSVIAKALEPLEGGTGTIRVLVLSR